VIGDSAVPFDGDQAAPLLQFIRNELLRSMSNREQRMAWMVFAGLVLLIIWALMRTASMT
jgi:hypothetical protein